MSKINVEGKEFKALVAKVVTESLKEGEPRLAELVSKLLSDYLDEIKPKIIASLVEAMDEAKTASEEPKITKSKPEKPSVAPVVENPKETKAKTKKPVEEKPKESKAKKPSTTSVEEKDPKTMTIPQLKAGIKEMGGNFTGMKKKEQLVDEYTKLRSGVKKEAPKSKATKEAEAKASKTKEEKKTKAPPKKGSSASLDETKLTKPKNTKTPKYENFNEFSEDENGRIVNKYDFVVEKNKIFIGRIKDGKVLALTAEDEKIIKAASPNSKIQKLSQEALDEKYEATEAGEGEESDQELNLSEHDGEAEEKSGSGDPFESVVEKQAETTKKESTKKKFETILKPFQKSNK